MIIRIYTDGAARGNPGKSASGYHVYINSQLVIEGAFYNGICTNNIAEYEAALKALEKVYNEYGRSNSIKLYSDSKLMVNQLKHLYKIKNETLKKLNARVLEIAGKFDSCEFVNVPRENKHIAAVDASINRFLDSLDNNKYDSSNTIRDNQRKL